MNVACRICSCFAAAVFVIAAHGGNGDLNLPDDRAFDSFPTQPEVPSSFLGRFSRAYDDRAVQVFGDLLHPIKVMQINFKSPGETWEQTLERGDRAVENAFLKSFEYSLRDASLELPVMDWLDQRQDALGNFLTDSVDAVEEEAVAPFDLSYGQVERSWWKKLAEKRDLRFGARPFRKSPYAFVALRIEEAGRTLFLANARYYLRNFSDHRFELSLSIPAPFGMSCDLGTYYQFGRHDVQRRLVVKLFKQLKHGIAHLGVEVQRTPVMFAGVTMTF